MPIGKSLVFPQAIALTHRPVDVPGRGMVLCVSAFLPFRLSDGEPISTMDWYTILSEHGGDNAVPDSMSPLPGAEVVVVGKLPPVVEEYRKASIQCGSLVKNFTLYADPENPNAPIIADPSAAVWHKEDNPDGRGGPDDKRKPLIISDDAPDDPIWLGVTPYDHPVRMRRIGIPDVASGVGWPSSADPSVLYDTHSAFWSVNGFHPGELLEIKGLSEHDQSLHLPRYRIVFTSRCVNRDWALESSRIHCVMLLPSQDAGSVIWRASIPLGDDTLGESVVILVAALEDADAPMKEDAAEHWARIVMERWEFPDRALDDRPLLPAKLAAAVVLPLALGSEANAEFEQRRQDTEDWLRNEYDIPEDNPFESAAPDEVSSLSDKIGDIAGADGDESPKVLDTAGMGDIADKVIGLSKRRHLDAGFEEPTPEQQRESVVRGSRLSPEIKTRLLKPYKTEREVALAQQLDEHASGKMDSKDVLESITKARIISNDPPLYWPAMIEEEAIKFGDKVFEHLSEENLERHIDISAAKVIGETRDDGSYERNISSRRLDGILAEESEWRRIEFSNCEFIGSTFAKGQFENCQFNDCIFRETNLSEVLLSNSLFENCTFNGLNLSDPMWHDCKFNNCVFDDVILSESAMYRLEFSGGHWKDVQILDGTIGLLKVHKSDWQDVMFMGASLPNCEFKQLSMFKVWGASKGMPGSVFEDVEATTCGFSACFHFGESQFIRTRFTETGFCNAIFKGSTFTPGCQFSACDMGGAVFVDAELTGVRFMQCLLPTSVWSNTKASDAWFFGSIVRGVDFKDTELSRAVFADADISGAKFLPDKTIGTDFRGTINSS